MDPCHLCDSDATHKMQPPKKLGSRENPQRIRLCDKHSRRFNTWYYRQLKISAERTIPTDHVRNHYPRPKVGGSQ